MKLYETLNKIKSYTRLMESIDWICCYKCYKNQETEYNEIIKLTILE